MNDKKTRIEILKKLIKGIITQGMYQYLKFKK